MKKEIRPLRSAGICAIWGFLLGFLAYTNPNLKGMDQLVLSNQNYDYPVISFIRTGEPESKLPTSCGPFSYSGSYTEHFAKPPNLPSHFQLTFA